MVDEAIAAMQPGNAQPGSVADQAARCYANMVSQVP